MIPGSTAKRMDDREQMQCKWSFLQSVRAGGRAFNVAAWLCADEKTLDIDLTTEGLADAPSVGGEMRDTVAGEGGEAKEPWVDFRTLFDKTSSSAFGTS